MKNGVRACQRLRQKHFIKYIDNMGPQHWWPKSPEEMMLGAILVQNTNWKNADMALMRLREKNTI